MFEGKRKRTTSPKTATTVVAARSGRRWSAKVTRTSDALDLPEGIFKGRSPHAIALGLRKSAEASQRRKASPFQSAMSMLNFELNRAGKGLPLARRRVLNQAKKELRKLYGRPAE